MTVYLIHIDPPLKHSAHYVGFTRHNDVAERMERHNAGTGGVLPREAVKNGSKLVLAYTWQGAPREFERYVKQHGGATRWCPVCGLNTRKIPNMEVFNDKPMC